MENNNWCLKEILVWDSEYVIAAILYQSVVQTLEQDCRQM
jgi:hypothetical protein